ncbi:MAG: hypothetical protein ABIH82_06005 [Candidatus Woesearchaeota archaeon]
MVLQQIIDKGFAKKEDIPYFALLCENPSLGEIDLHQYMGMAGLFKPLATRLKYRVSNEGEELGFPEGTTELFNKHRKRFLELVKERGLLGGLSPLEMMFTIDYVFQIVNQNDKNYSLRSAGRNVNPNCVPKNIVTFLAYHPTNFVEEAMIADYAGNLSDEQREEILTVERPIVNVGDIVEKYEIKGVVPFKRTLEFHWFIKKYGPDEIKGDCIDDTPENFARMGIPKGYYDDFVNRNRTIQALNDPVKGFIGTFYRLCDSLFQTHPSNPNFAEILCRKT